MDESPAVAVPADESPADESPADESPADVAPADAYLAGAVPAGEYPAGAVPAGEYPAGAVPAGECSEDRRLQAIGRAARSPQDDHRPLGGFPNQDDHHCLAAAAPVVSSDARLLPAGFRAECPAQEVLKDGFARNHRPGWTDGYSASRQVASPDDQGPESHEAAPATVARSKESLFRVESKAATVESKAATVGWKVATVGWKVATAGWKVARVGWRGDWMAATAGWTVGWKAARVGWKADWMAARVEMVSLQAWTDD